MMGKKSDQIKLYAVIGLSLVLVVLAYFRFIHVKANQEEDPAKSTAPVVELDFLQIKAKSAKKEIALEPTAHGPLQDIIRDIFSPLNSPKKAAGQDRKQRLGPGASLKLAGTIIGGKRPIAIINDRFVRPGDWIGEFEVISIGKEGVQLDSGDKKIALEIMTNE